MTSKKHATAFAAATTHTASRYGQASACMTIKYKTTKDNPAPLTFYSWQVNSVLYIGTCPRAKFLE
jgi:hypothetical protein